MNMQIPLTACFYIGAVRGFIYYIDINPIILKAHLFFTYITFVFYSVCRFKMISSFFMDAIY